MTPSELEQLILLSNPSYVPPNHLSADERLRQRAQATSLLDTMRSSPEAPRLCIELLRHTCRDEARFFALTTFQRCIDVTQLEERAEARSLLIELARNDELPTFLKTSIGVIIALIIRKDFPEHWCNAFDEIAFRLSKEIYFRVLDGISDEIVDTNDEKNTLIKDIIRGFSSFQGHVLSPPAPAQDTISGRMMELILEGILDGSNKAVGILAMGALKRFCSWLDMSLLIHPRMLEVFYSSLKNATPEKEEENLLATKAVQCLQEIVSRGMDERRKVQLLIDIALFRNLIYVPSNGSNEGAMGGSNGTLWNNETDIHLAIQISELVNGVGIELFSCWDSFLSAKDEPSKEEQQLVQTTGQLLHQYMSIFFQCFAYDDIDVTSAVLPMASRMIISLSKERERPCACFALLPYMPQFLVTLHNQMVYPPDFEFDYTDEDDSEEELFRYNLYKIYPRLVKMLPEQSLQFVCEILSGVSVPLSAAPTCQLEAALRLVYHYCEKVQGASSAVLTNETFQSVIVALHRSDIAGHSHREILVLYYDLSVRYGALLKEQPELLQRVLESMSGSQGIQHVHPRVRSRSCYLLLKLVKAMGGRVMRVYVEKAVGGIQGLLSNPATLPLRPEDTFYLFETIGLLLGTTNIPPLQQQQFMTAVISPHVQLIRSLLDNPCLTRDPNDFAEKLSNSIAAIAHLSKGFSKPTEEVQCVLVETMSISLAVLQALPDQAIIRNKTLVLLQRLVLCLGDKVLSNIPHFLSSLIQYSTQEDIIDVSQLLNQLCIKFHTSAISIINLSLKPFLLKCRALLPDNGSLSGSTALSHIQLETLAIQKCIYITLQHIITHSLTPVLVSEENIGILEEIIQTMKLGAVSIAQDATLNKTCIIFFQDLFQQWARGSDATAPSTTTTTVSTEVQSSFLNFVFADLMPAMINFILDPSFKERDALQARNVTEIAKFLCLVKDCRTPDFEAWVLRMNCPEEVKAGLTRSKCAKDMRECLKYLMKTMKT